MKHIFTELSDIRQAIRQHYCMDEQSTLDLLMTLSCRLAQRPCHQFIDTELAENVADKLDDLIGQIEEAIVIQDEIRMTEWLNERDKAYCV